MNHRQEKIDMTRIKCKHYKIVSLKIVVVKFLTRFSVQ